MPKTTIDEEVDDFTPPRKYIAEFGAIRIARYDMRNWVVWDAKDKQQPIPHYFGHLGAAFLDAAERVSSRNARTLRDWFDQYQEAVEKFSQVLDSAGVRGIAPNSSQPTDIQAVSCISTVLRQHRTKRTEVA